MVSSLMAKSARLLKISLVTLQYSCRNVTCCAFSGLVPIHNHMQIWGNKSQRYGPGPDHDDTTEPIGGIANPARRGPMIYTAASSVIMVCCAFIVQNDRLALKEIA